MDDYLGPDLISDLPQSIIEIILIRLPITEAVKTSILSRKWRYKWATINQLVFDEKSVDDQLDDGEADKFIIRALSLHHGPIHKFKIKNLFLPEIDKWFLFLSRTDIKELILEFNTGCPSVQSVPSCLFNCKKLTHLGLDCCDLDPHPPTFEGFMCLKSLILDEVLIKEEALARLISSCPLLENLSLTYIVDLTVFHIRAPNLKCLYVEGNFFDICLEDTPLLVEASVERYWGDEEDDSFYMDYLQSQCLSWNFIKSLDSLPNLERLIGRGCFTNYLRLCNYSRTLPTTKYYLKIIVLDEVNFADLEERLVVLRLITNSPNLQQLHIISRTFEDDDKDAPDLELDLKECYSECTLKHLEIVNLKFIRCWPKEMEFIKFLLGSSPVLESMIIATDLVGENHTKLLVELLKFHRASARAAIEIIGKC